MITKLFEKTHNNASVLIHFENIDVMMPNTANDQSEIIDLIQQKLQYIGSSVVIASSNNPYNIHEKVQAMFSKKVWLQKSKENERKEMLTQSLSKLDHDLTEQEEQTLLDISSNIALGDLKSLLEKVSDIPMKQHCENTGIDISLMDALSDSLSLRKLNLNDFKTIVSA